MEEIYCLMISGRGLDNETSTLLYRTACSMLGKGRTHELVKTNEYEAAVRTDYNFVMIGGIGGIKFVADIETDTGIIHAEFIIQNRDVDKAAKDGVWVSIPERQPSFNPSLN